jgi:hypothetical protein
MPDSTSMVLKRAPGRAPFAVAAEAASSVRAALQDILGGDGGTVGCQTLQSSDIGLSRPGVHFYL